MSTAVIPTAAPVRRAVPEKRRNDVTVKPQITHYLHKTTTANMILQVSQTPVNVKELMGMTLQKYQIL